MRGLLLDRLFVGPRDGNYLTRPHGRFGCWRRVTEDQRNRLIDLYLYAVQGAALFAAFGLYRHFFGDSAGLEDVFWTSGFTFGLSISVTQTWVLADAPKVSAPVRGRPDAGKSNPATPVASSSAVTQAPVVLLAMFCGGCVCLTGLVLRESDLAIAGSVAIAMAGLLLLREMLLARRSNR